MIRPTLTAYPDLDAATLRDTDRFDDATPGEVWAEVVARWDGMSVREQTNWWKHEASEDERAIVAEAINDRIRVHILDVRLTALAS